MVQLFFTVTISNNFCSIHNCNGNEIYYKNALVFNIVSIMLLNIYIFIFHEKKKIYIYIDR